MRKSGKFIKRNKINNKKDTGDFFICIQCGMNVSLKAFGTKERNHCPFCLWSIHIDLRPGDRKCFCKGGMAPISVWIKDDGEWSIIHRCTICGMLKTNRIAGDDNEEELINLVKKPLQKVVSISED